MPILKKWGGDMKSNHFEIMFSKRCVLCFSVIMLLFFSCILRVAVASVSDYQTVQEEQSCYRLKAGDLRGTIYDCNMVPLTNAQSSIVAAVSPTPRAVTAISSVLKGEELKNVLFRLQSGKPVLCKVPEIIDCDGIVCTEVYQHVSQDTLATHMIGYTDYEGHGVSGLEKAYDELLYCGDSVSFAYTMNGVGEILEGIAPRVENNTAKIASGVISTLDINLQSIAEEAANSMDAGAVVIAESETSKIRAAVSRPNFDLTNVSAFLSEGNSALFNRLTAAYNVGSVFKPCVAAAGMEDQKGGFIYRCTGACHIIDRDFRCHKQDGHGLMTLKTGLANSCNTYFYNFAFLLGGEKIYNMASSLNFGKSFSICNGLTVSPGSMPDKESLSNIAYLANFSIGQGELLVSPIAMLNLYCAAASDGAYYIPSVVEATVENGERSEYDIGAKTKVMSKKTAAMLRDDLTAVITDGTGTAAAPKSVTAAGKTATAQTGKFENGREICEGWFCGFFPAENPKYTVIIFSQNTAKQTASCGEIFAEIADQVAVLQGLTNDK